MHLLCERLIIAEGDLRQGYFTKFPVDLLLYSAIRLVLFVFYNQRIFLQSPDVDVAGVAAGAVAG